MQSTGRQGSQLQVREPVTASGSFSRFGNLRLAGGGVPHQQAPLSSGPRQVTSDPFLVKIMSSGVPSGRVERRGRCGRFGCAVGGRHFPTHRRVGVADHRDVHARVVQGEMCSAP